MEDWKTKSNTMQMELNELKAQYKEMENKVWDNCCIGLVERHPHQVDAAKEKNTGLVAQKEELTGKQVRLAAKLDQLTTDNRWGDDHDRDHDDIIRNLKTALLEAERYREEFREVAELLALLKV